MAADLSTVAELTDDNRQQPPRERGKEEWETIQYPGCFKKSVAFLIDQIVIIIAGIAIFFPFSGFIETLYHHGWLPGYLLGAAYFAVMESSILKGQSIGKRLFSIKAATIKGKPLSPLASVGRYLLITFPFLNGSISNSMASTIGITNTQMGGIIFLVVVGVLFSGNTLFMLFHPQKRGLHDILCGSVVLPAKEESIAPVSHFTLKPVISGIICLAILGGLSNLSGNLLMKAAPNHDLSEIIAFSDRLKKEASMDNISASYRTFFTQGKQTTLSIDVHVPVPYNKFDDKEFTDVISNRLYPLVNRLNTNPKVDTITIVFHAIKYYGSFSSSKMSRNPRSIVEIDQSAAVEQPLPHDK